MVAASHSRSESTNEAPANSAIPEAWSKWRWVMTTVEIVFGSTPLARSWAGRSSPGSSSGRPYQATARPMFAEGFEVTEGWRPVSTTKCPAVGWVTR